MRIKTKDLSYKEVCSLPAQPRLKPKRPSIVFRTLLKVLGGADLKATGFTCETEGMENLAKDEPALFLMNHSSFIDLKIASSILYPRPFNIICTSDGFVGKSALMRNLGCIPATKFVNDPDLVKDIFYAVRKLKNSILMYPEASYTFDGTATPLPESVGKLVKKLGIALVMIKTCGAFLRDPLYNMLQLRKVRVSAKMKYVLSPEQIKTMKVEEINSVLKELFTFDNFRDQQNSRTKVDESFRADGLNRVLYKCPVCGTEGEMEGKGTKLKCRSCNTEWELSEYGHLKTEGNKGVFDHVPDWYKWERECVKKEIENGTYKLDINVLIRMLVDTKYIYNVGRGRLVHTREGFHLTGCDGELDYTQRPERSYSLYSDYHWYEIGDMICIGDSKALYYCFPEGKTDVVAKTRIAAEELFRLC